MTKTPAEVAKQKLEDELDTVEENLDEMKVKQDAHVLINDYTREPVREPTAEPMHHRDYLAQDKEVSRKLEGVSADKMDKLQKDANEGLENLPVQPLTPNRFPGAKRSNEQDLKGDELPLSEHNVVQFPTKATEPKVNEPKVEKPYEPLKKLSAFIHSIV